ncbi:MAG: thiamine phosphate synthase [Nanoarchaeota archaeon]
MSCWHGNYKGNIKKIKIPYVAIGGINETNIEVVLSAGAKNVAMISAILTKKDIKKELRKYQNYFLTLRGIK